MKLLTVKQVADFLSAKPSTIYQWAEQGVIPCFKLNGLLRFEESDVMAWIIDCKKNPGKSYNNSTGRRPGREDRK